MTYIGNFIYKIKLYLLFKTNEIKPKNKLNSNLMAYNNYKNINNCNEYFNTYYIIF